MFQTFTGSSRRPRNVNLSGRNPNPFAKSPQNAVANAQQDRLARHVERQRLESARVLQRTWRGYKTRRSIKDALRQEWDAHEHESGKAAAPYKSEAKSMSQLQLLLHFFTARPESTNDALRLRRYYERHLKTASQIPCTGGPWPLAYLRLENSCLEAIERGNEQANQIFREVLQFIVQEIPRETAYNSQKYYRALRKEKSSDLATVLAPLQTISPATLFAYMGFAAQYLTITNTITFAGQKPGDLGPLANGINCRLLGSAVASLLKDESILSQHLKGAQARAWLLARFIYFYRFAYNFMPTGYAADKDFVKVVASLLSSVAEHIDMEPQENDLEDNDLDNALHTVDAFLREQVSSLVNQESVGGILKAENIDSRLLSSYILTIIRLFPRRGDEIRMWLYLSLSPSMDERPHRPVSAIKYFWSGARNTRTYELILEDSRAALDLLKPKASSNSSDWWPKQSNDVQAAIQDQWKVILIFIELYSFVLKIMDDDEFFSGGRALRDSVPANSSFSRDNALLLSDVEELTTFLKHLGFTMYYNASEIAGNSREDTERSLASLFKSSDVAASSAESNRSTKKPTEPAVAGIGGITLDYMKGSVTGLLRMIYERDSRRPFLPKDHWLMTERFDMDKFIDSVVSEEERRHQVQEEDDEDASIENIDDTPISPVQPLIGSTRLSHTQNNIRMEQLRRQQRQASRQRYLQAVAPRLEILQNMPFLIPFRTRVQIFRRFIHRDMFSRRHGYLDPDQWRMSQMVRGVDPFMANNPMAPSRHHAKIRRNHEFEDAFEQYYDLGTALKEPIQITFVDQFDTVEAGIDGGGVTKEFLTSVTDQAFAPADGINLFVENDQHLLYPNPAAIDQQRELLRNGGIREGSDQYRASISSLLKRYEFLGRVIGKCLYESILVDIGFAGFFLLKWALTGSPGSAPKESGYRANLNDLRDFDEALYQGLLQLKNYPGNVEEDFNLNFTAEDTISLPSDPHTKSVTRDLRPNGATMPVTAANRLVYISYLARYRLQTQPYAQTAAFLRGLAAIISPAWLSMFNQQELQTLVGGAASQISIPDLRAHTIYGGVYEIGSDGQEHPSVRLFWAVMEELPDAERRKVLKFVTSTPRAPLLGFGSLRPRFSLRDAGQDESRLPSTSTCVNLLKLPMYTDKRRLKEKLVQAVNAGAGFDLS